jgi:hypothetical protein
MRKYLRLKKEYNKSMMQLRRRAERLGINMDVGTNLIPNPSDRLQDEYLT